MPIERLDVHATTDRLQTALHQARYDFALERIPSDASVLEIGTGAGAMSAQLLAKCPGYTGVEFDPEAIEITRQKVGSAAKIIQADARALPFPSRTFSRIVCLEVLEHLGDFIRGVQEIHRCLQPGGAAIVSVPYRKVGGKSETNPYHLYEPGEAEICQAFRGLFGEVAVYSQYFEESPLMTAARTLRLRRVLGLVGPYRALTEGQPEALRRLRIGPRAGGMKINVILVASHPS